MLDDAEVLASIGTVGDCYDNAMAESFVDSYKTELIADRIWRTRSQLELGSVDYVAWFNHKRLHESLGDIPPVEFEALHATEIVSTAAISGNGSVQALASRPADGLRTRRVATVDVDFGPSAPILSENGAVPHADNGAVDQALLAQAAPTGVVR